MKTSFIYFGLIGVLLLSSCKSNNEAYKSITITPYTLCEPDKAKLSLKIECAYRGQEPRSAILYFPEEIGQYNVPQGLALEECISTITIAPFDPPDPQRWTYGFLSANLTNLVVSVAGTQPNLIGIGIGIGIDRP